MNHIERWLRERIGLDAAVTGSAVARAVRSRMKTLAVRSPAAYERVLEACPAERAELVESVVVAESWFFRDEEPFAAVVRLVRDAWLPSDHTRTVRLLSLPCASGEEPYSLVMALLDAGIPRARFQVHAVDISARGLARARLGVYGKNSFRTADLGFRTRHFVPGKEGFVLEPAIRSSVHFHQGNLLAPEADLGPEPYDVVFCRNLLIYFDREMQQKALARLERLLAPDGVLFVGAAEQPLFLAHHFVTAKLPLAFACRKAQTEGSAPSHGHHATRSAQPPPPSPDLRARVPSRSKAPPSGEPNVGPRPDLGQARQLADAGRLFEAAAICDAHLRQSGPSAPAYYLLGLIRDATGDPCAVEYYRKALYLEPEHYESLLQLALHAQRNGDGLSARTLKRRALRASRPSPNE